MSLKKVINFIPLMSSFLYVIRRDPDRKVETWCECENADISVL